MINVGEVYYQKARNEDVMSADRALAWLRSTSIRIVDVDLITTIEAARIKATHPISYADCFAVALAREMQASVITGDPEFEILERDNIVAVEWLPAKPRRR